MTHPLRPYRSPAAGPAGKIAALLLGVALAIGLPAHAADSAGLKVSNAWMRFIMPSRPAAGYFTLTNDSDDAQTLTGASSPACGSIMMHQSMQKSGMAHMAMVESVAVPAHGTLTFAPGGYHLMCMSPQKNLHPGDIAPATLHFSDGQAITAQFKIRNAAGQ